MPDLLLELFSEEIPAGMQVRAVSDLQRLVCDGLVDAGITYSTAAAFVTPRRLCLNLGDLPAQTQALVEERKGPRVDAPQKALDGFLRATGLTTDQLQVRDDKKGQIYYAAITQPARDAADVVAAVVAETIRTFPWPKSMRWGSGNLRWVRPLHHILCILYDDNGAAIVPVDVEGVPCGDTTRGHRFMADDAFSVASFDGYADGLKARHVILDSVARRDIIKADADSLAFAQGLEVVEDAALLAEVAGLVEWPVVLMGDIAPDFTDLPAEVLQTSMRTHQKFFSLRNPKSGRIKKFITVANRETADSGATILAGNQKVLFARLSDARFFWDNDLRVPLADMAAKLENVTFHNKLGTQAARIERVAALAGEIAPLVAADKDMAVQAARIAKADLASEMVGEFPELQGIMGGYYARAAGLPEDVAAACAEHYAPLGPSDAVPTAPVSVAVALADKIDTLTGFWAIDEKPTGSKDPFALRRAALGVIRLILKNKIRLDFEQLLLGRIAAPRIRHDLCHFVVKRLTQALKDQGVRNDLIDACFAGGAPGNAFQVSEESNAPDLLDQSFGEYDFYLVAQKASALSNFLQTDDGENLLQGFKRANNILRAEEARDGVSYEGEPDVKFARDDSEKTLFAALDVAGGAISAALKAEEFAAAMTALAALRAPIDAFFEAVQVNADSQIVRRNRLCLLNRIRETMGKVAAFEKITGA